MLRRVVRFTQLIRQKMVLAEPASNPEGYKRVDGDRLIKTIQVAFSLNKFIFFARYH
jgi:hypothetical protein